MGNYGKIIGNGLIYLEDIMTEKEIKASYAYYMKKFEENKDLGQFMAKITYQQIFNPKFLKANSKWNSIDEMIYGGGFGIMSLGEVPNVNQDKWDAYIQRNTKCSGWFIFGKLAMIEWMKETIRFVEESKKM